MNRIALIALGGLGMSLGGIIAAELHDARAPVFGPLAAPARLTPPPAAAPPPDRTAAWVAAVLARPLFDRSRRPPLVAAPVAAGHPAPPRLSGIMISPAGKSAIFSPTDGKTIIAAEGGRVGAFIVRSISADRVTVAGPDGVDVLHTVFSAGKPGAPAAALPAAPPFAGLAGMTGTSGGIALTQGKADLPNAATWPGPPGLSALPGAHPPAASFPLLTRPSPGAGAAG